MPATGITITILGSGTSSGVPMIGCDCPVCISKDPKDSRLRSSILVRSKNTAICVDTGPDFRYQMLREEVKQLDAVLFTHPHKDHVAGLDDVRAFNFFSGKAMPVYSNELTASVLMREFPYAFSEKKYPGVPEIELNIIDNSPFIIGDISVQPIMLWHLKMPVYGFRFGNFTYITDANRIEASEMEKIKGTEVLVLNTLRKEKHISHFTLSEGIEIAKSLNIPKTYFTHISHQMGKHEEIMKELPQGVELAYDGLEFSV